VRRAGWLLSAALALYACTRPYGFPILLCALGVFCLSELLDEVRNG
jgi:hypothetical protein